MKYVFVYHTDEWKYVGKAIKRYFKYVKGVNDNDFKVTNVLNGQYDVLIVPLFEDGEPKGLETVRNLRQDEGKKRQFKTFFLVLFEDEIPDFLHPEKKMQEYAMDIIKNPEFGNTNKAVFLGEIRYKENNDIYLNIISLSEGVEKLHKILDCNKLPQIDKSSIKAYYEIFVRFYRGKLEGKLCEFINEIKEECGHIEKIKRKWSEQLPLTLNSIEAQLFLETANDIYNCLNGIKSQTYDHAVPLELFRAPLPFPLQELRDAKEEIEKVLDKDKNNAEEGKIKPKIKLLLIDNKFDKLEKDGPLLELFKTFKLNDIFEKIEMLKDKQYDVKEGIFDFGKFKEDINDLFADESNKENNYAWKVYQKIKNSHFILLDFFLNKENTYLGFDFIKDINKIKRKNNDYSTTWYFITSAVYDAVVKYAQSGLLAEFYESAVVNAGDDPTNEKRQIIFVYKLLTFINARLRNFQGCKDRIFYKLLSNKVDENNCISCCVNALVKDEKMKKIPDYQKQCEKGKCLKNLQTDIKKLLAEYENVGSIFFNEKETQEVYKTIAEVLDNLIKQFFWLPEADWQIIQHQIDFVNEKLESIGEERRFSCNYILDEIKRRSEIY